jgi:hypothetical protein
MEQQLVEQITSTSKTSCWRVYIALAWWGKMALYHCFYLFHNIMCCFSNNHGSSRSTNHSTIILTCTYVELNKTKVCWPCAPHTLGPYSGIHACTCIYVGICVCAKRLVLRVMRIVRLPVAHTCLTQCKKTGVHIWSPSSGKIYVRISWNVQRAPGRVLQYSIAGKRRGEQAPRHHPVPLRLKTRSAHQPSFQCIHRMTTSAHLDLIPRVPCNMYMLGIICWVIFDVRSGTYVNWQTTFWINIPGSFSDKRDIQKCKELYDKSW